MRAPLLAEPLCDPRVKVVLAGTAGVAPALRMLKLSAAAAHAIICGPAPLVPQHLPGTRSGTLLAQAFAVSGAAAATAQAP